MFASLTLCRRLSLRHGREFLFVRVSIIVRALQKNETKNDCSNHRPTSCNDEVIKHFDLDEDNSRLPKRIHGVTSDEKKKRRRKKNSRPGERAVKQSRLCQMKEFMVKFKSHESEATSPPKQVPRFHSSSSPWRLRKKEEQKCSDVFLLVYGRRSHLDWAVEHKYRVWCRARSR